MRQRLLPLILAAPLFGLAGPAEGQKCAAMKNRHSLTPPADSAPGKRDS